MKKTTLIIISLFIFASGFYIYFLFIPEQQLLNTIENFENACREENEQKYKSIISKNSRLFEHISEIKDIKEIFEKFEPEIKIIEAVHIPNFVFEKDTVDVIFGKIKKKAKIDDEYREFPEITLAKENDEWIIRQFFFPDYKDY